MYALLYGIIYMIFVLLFLRVFSFHFVQSTVMKMIYMRKQMWVRASLVTQEKVFVYTGCNKRYFLFLNETLLTTLFWEDRIDILRLGKNNLLGDTYIDFTEEGWNENYLFDVNIVYCKANQSMLN